MLERNGQSARKILATGNGRCNYSNEASPYAQEVIAFLRERCGIEPAEEEGRIYPRSMEASSVAEALISCTKRLGAEIKCGAKAESVQKNAQGFVVKCEDGSAFESEKLILATGGKAGIQYGCYGDGYGFAQALGHSVLKPIPALDGLCVEEDISDLHGVRAAAKASLFRVWSRSPADGTADSEDLIAREFGEVQFTKNGISGICVMDLSRYVRLSESGYYRLSLDFFPDETAWALTEKLIQREQDFGCGLK